jgi:hypothetical protein
MSRNAAQSEGAAFLWLLIRRLLPLLAIAILSRKSREFSIYREPPGLEVQCGFTIFARDAEQGSITKWMARH